MKNRLPSWFKQEIPDANLIGERVALFKKLRLNTVCQSAHCPNIFDCFKRKTATFMILGDTCTRDCRFCAVKKGEPQIVDSGEPENIVSAVKVLELNYVVITSVTRDDLQDGGANRFAQIVNLLHSKLPQVKVEVLIPDFKGKKESLVTVAQSHPEVIGHNLETISRLYPQIRPQADYQRSLDLLAQVKEIDNSIITKSGIMAGLGEDFAEIIKAMVDLREVDCDILTIGQYLSPSASHLPVERFVTKEEFAELERIALSMGFRGASCAPLARSSYHSAEVFAQCMM
ncbi:MAG: lipoyl synthase [Candidatus Omnitrophota bacterium]|nr:lipoyl synthase [Candidatus Omnitrophota bacterium]